MRTTREQCHGTMCSRAPAKPCVLAPCLSRFLLLIIPSGASRARRWGAFYYAEQVLRVMKGYGWTIVMYGVGQPVAYLFAMGVGLATLVEANGAGVFGGVTVKAWMRRVAAIDGAATMPAMLALSMPPLRLVPTGTSERRRRATDAASRDRKFAIAPASSAGASTVPASQ